MRPVRRQLRPAGRLQKGVAATHMDALCKIRDLQRAVARFEGMFEARYGICLNEGMVLCTLSKVERMCPGELGEAMGLTPSNMSKVLRAAETKGLVARELCCRDRRQTFYSLTGNCSARWTAAPSRSPSSCATGSGRNKGRSGGRKKPQPRRAREGTERRARLLSSPFRLRRTRRCGRRRPLRQASVQPHEKTPNVLRRKWRQSGKFDLPLRDHNRIRCTSWTGSRIFCSNTRPCRPWW